VLAVALALAGVAPAGAAQSDPKGDATGPLDVVSADVTAQGSNLEFTVSTGGAWSPADLVAAGTRSLCLKLTGADIPQVCVQAVGRRAVLIAPGSTQPITAAVHRPNDRSLQARFAPDQVGLKAGADFRWQVVTAYDGSTDEAPSASVQATVPQAQVVGCNAGGASYRTNGPRDHRVVALTFDDGPFPLTPKFYDVLEREHVPATFFLIGDQVPGKGALLKRALRDGFVLGDHTWTHADVSGDGPAAARQISLTKNAIRRATGYTPCLFRAPGGAVSAPLISEARGQGMNTIEWDVDPTDWSTPGTNVIYSRVIAQTRPGSIILMHDGGGPRGQTLAALPRIIATLRARGYKFDTVPQLLGLQPVYAGG
jgi:peptidoglycan-N-acetylglucosamine deacetylase